MVITESLYKMVVLYEGIVYAHTYVHIQCNLSIVDTVRTQLAVMYREMAIIQRYVDLYTALCGWDSRHCPH